jgi:hypothetical protein
MTIRAAFLDPRGVFLKMVELESVSELTERHVPTITQCDLPPGQYLWIPDGRRRLDGSLVNEYGGAFHELAWLRRLAATRRKQEELVPEHAPRNEEVSLLVEYLEDRGLYEAPGE